ncbi:MAG: hypothetical protein LWY06_15170 [Firmicutes bacterium]|nr:hypothetical protein [Bacillota bacterium]
MIGSFLFAAAIEDNPEKIRQSLDSILSQRQFSGLLPQNKGMLQKLIESLGNNEIVRKVIGALFSVLEFISKFIVSRPEILYIFLGLLLTGIIAYVVIMVRRKISGSRLKSHGDEEHAESINPDVREKQGLTAAEAGDFVQAMRQLYVSLLLCLNLQGVIEYNPSRTNRETENLLRGRSPENFFASFCGLNGIFEDKVYALNPCNPEDFNEFRKYYEFCRKEVEKI